MLPTLGWTTYDVSEMFPPHWRQDVQKTAIDADFRDFPRTPVISREAVGVERISRGRVHADQVKCELPWLYKFYRSSFLELAQHVAVDSALKAAGDERYEIVLNVQQGPMMRLNATLIQTRLRRCYFLPITTGVRAVNWSSEMTVMLPARKRSTGHVRFFARRLGI